MTIINEERFTGLPTNFGLLRKDIKSSDLEDKNVKRIDDAKKKAITTSRDYEEFRGLVDTSHLKPIHRSEFNTPAKAGSVNAFYNGKAASSVVHSSMEVDLDSKSAIQSKDDFCRQFNRSRDKKGFLYAIDLEVFKRFFEKTMEEEMFAEIVQLCVDHKNDAQFINIASTLRSFQYFDKVSQFLSAKEKDLFNDVL